MKATPSSPKYSREFQSVTEGTAIPSGHIFWASTACQAPFQKFSHTLSFEISSVYIYCALSLLFLYSLQILLKLTYLSIINGLCVHYLPSQTCLQKIILLSSSCIKYDLQTELQEQWPCSHFKTVLEQQCLRASNSVSPPTFYFQINFQAQSVIESTSLLGFYFHSFTRKIFVKKNIYVKHVQVIEWITKQCGPCLLTFKWGIQINK